MLRAPPLGKLLLDTGVLTQQALEQILVAQRTDKRRLGELLVEKNLVRPDQLAQLLSRQLSCPWVSLQRIEIPPNVLALIPREVAEEFHVVPVHLRVASGAKILYVATDDPTDEDALSECAFAAKMKVRPMVAITSEIHAALSRFYSITDHTKPHPKKPAPPASRASMPDMRAVVPEALESAEAIEDVELVPVSTDEPLTTPGPIVVTINAPPGFLEQCRQAAKALRADIVDVPLVEIAPFAEKSRPCAIVVTEDVYAFDRAMLSRLALDIDAVLVVWSDDIEGKQLEPLLEGAVKRWRRSAYEKGTFIEGRYELLRDLGGAIGGSRWEVRHARTRRRAVLKVGVRAAEDVSDVQAVEREQDALARVQHPAAVDLFDGGNTELGDPYIVLELVEGRTVEGLVTARERLSPAEASSIFHQVADCLVAAHAAGVTHGAVRPESVVLVRDGYGIERAKLVDWESARASDSGCSLTDVDADVAALGQCLFHALVGRDRLSDEDVAAALAAAGVPPALASVVERAIGQERFVAIGDLRHALEDAEPAAREPTHLFSASLRERKSEAPRTDVAAPSPTDTQKTQAMEQRKFARAPYRTPVRVEVPGVGAFDGRSEDVSCGGLFIVTHADITTGTSITIRFALPIDGRVISEGAVVRWSRAARGGGTPEAGLPVAIGIELESPAAETQRQIERYVSLMGEDTPHA